MEKRSEHYGDVSKWIEKGIDSCETYEQTTTAERLVSNFDNQLKTKRIEKYWREHFYNLISPLESSLSYKRDELLKKQLES